MIIKFDSIEPQIHEKAWLAPTSVVIGNTQIGEGSSVWFNTVIRGDVNSISIGKNTNIQDLSMVHVSNADGPQPAPTIIGDNVTVGHRVIIHGCTIGSNCLIGMGSIVMDRVVIGDNCMIAAGSLVTEGMKIPEGHLVLGSPAKVLRPLKQSEIDVIEYLAEHYRKLAAKYT